MLKLVKIFLYEEIFLGGTHATSAMVEWPFEKSKDNEKSAT